MPSTRDFPSPVMLSNCIACGLALPLRLPGTDELGEEWACNGCGAEFTAIYVDEFPADLRQNVRRLSGPTTQPSENILAEAFASHGTLRHVPPKPRGIRSRLQTRLSLNLDELTSDPAKLIIPPQGAPLSKRCIERGTEPYDEQLARNLFDSHSVKVQRIGSIFKLLATGSNVNMKDVLEILTEIIEQSTQDNDLMVCLGINAKGTDYPSRHSVHTAIVAMSIGITMGLDEKTVSELGLGCLVHDLGMLAVSSQIQSNRPFGVEHHMEVATHPVHTLEMIKRDYDDVPESSKMVAYQMHERCNGTGYPRGRTGDSIHDLAKIAMVADAYVALTADRFFRPAMTPYYAVLKILEEVREGQFDPTVVRGMLQTISLFPIGSYVTFGDELYGKVLRRNLNQYDRPIVEIWNANDTSKRPLIVDLSTAPDWPSPMPTTLNYVLRQQ